MECQGSGTPRKGGIWHAQRCPVKTGNCRDQEMLAGEEEEEEEAGSIISQPRLKTQSAWPHSRGGQL